MDNDVPKMSPTKLASTLNIKVGIRRLKNGDITNGYEKFSGFDKCITSMVSNFEIVDSLENMFRIGKITLLDPYNYREVAPLTGNEIFTISYKNGISDSGAPEKIINFRIFTMKEIKASGTKMGGNKSIEIILVEFPIFDLLTANAVYKTYKIEDNYDPYQRISDIVSDSLNLVPNLNKWYQFDIEKTPKNNINFWIPNWTPMKTINYLKTLATSEKTGFPYYMFHTMNGDGKDFDLNKPVITFKSIYSMVKDEKKIRKYSLTDAATMNKPISVDEDVAKKISTPKQSTCNLADVILGYYYDIFDGSRISFGGLSGETKTSFDYLEDNNYYGSDYSDFIDKNYKSISPFVLHSQRYGNQWSRMYPTAWRKKEADLLMKQYSYNEYAKNTLMGGTRCTAVTRVYENRTPGERADLLLLSGDDEQQADLMMSGHWITWSITDKFDGSEAYSEVVFIKDSFSVINNDDKYFKQTGTVDGGGSTNAVKQSILRG